MTAIQDSWIRDVRIALRDSDVDFFKIKPSIYWTDFFVSATVAYLAASVYLISPLFSWSQIIAFPFAIFWLYRLGSLVHEVSHLPQKEMRLFKTTWNLLVGVMTLAPSPFFTAHHRDHHTQRMYGSPQDPEYVINICRPGSWLSLLGYFALMVVFPALVFLRFLLAPLTFLHPKLRQFVLTRASSLTMNWRYERKQHPSELRTLTAIELLCWVRATMIPTAVLLGVAPWTRIPLLYLLAASILLFNQMRQLADHHFQSHGGKISFAEHILDSCNYTGNDPLTWLFFPFAIRYHALHHIFPSLPYHNLSAAHASLLRRLPAESPYRLLDQPSWWSVAKAIRQPVRRLKQTTDRAPTDLAA